MDDAKRAEFWKIEAFGNHLGANNNVIIAIANFRVFFTHLLVSAGVGVKTGDFGIREDFFGFFFDKFGAEAFVMNAGVFAFWTAGRDGIDAAAGMAAHLEIIGVENQGEVAV